jgi:hypothetical protein
VVTVMAKLKVQPGKESAFEGAAGELIAYV